MRILVTGGAGFIGSHFVRRLAAAGDDVVVLDKLTYAGNLANLQGVEHDFRGGDIVDPAGVAAAAAAATRSSTSPPRRTSTARSSSGADFLRTNVLGVHTLLDEARASELRLVQVSTDEVYGDIPPGRSSNEDDPLQPSSPYSASKAGGDLLVLAYVRTYGVDALITRGSNTYGPHQYPGEAPAALHHERARRRAAAGLRRRPAAPRLAPRRRPLRRHRARARATGTAGEIYNVGGGKSSRTGRSPARPRPDRRRESLIRRVDDRPGHDRRYSLDSAKLDSLGWKKQLDARPRACRRPSSGTARTATGGSRSRLRRASAPTTNGSTQRCFGAGVEVQSFLAPNNDLRPVATVDRCSGAPCC